MVSFYSPVWFYHLCLHLQSGTNFWNVLWSSETHTSWSARNVQYQLRFFTVLRCDLSTLNAKNHLVDCEHTENILLLANKCWRVQPIFEFRLFEVLKGLAWYTEINCLYLDSFMIMLKTKTFCSRTNLKTPRDKKKSLIFTSTSQTIADVISYHREIWIIHVFS